MKYNVPEKNELKKILTDIQYKVTQKDKTEPPFKNEFWDNKEDGIYVDVVTGEPLFSSTHKYDSGTGWPSFYQAIREGALVEKSDRTMFLQPRTEVRSKVADSHLGHVFKDGPEPSGMRFCINSAAMKFIPKSEMESLGYGEFLALFS